MAIDILVESASDLQKGNRHGVTVNVLPIKVLFEDGEYEEDVTMTKDLFYTKLKQCTTLPKTSQITPYAYEQAIEASLNKGNQVLVLCISSALSGCYQNAMNIKQQYDHDVVVIDTQSATIGIGLLVDYAISCIQQGATLQQVQQQLEQKKKEVCVFAALDTLENLEKGGRISKVSAFAGKLLGIKPIVTIQDGAVQFFEKARGTKASHKILVNQIHDVDEEYGIFVAYSGQSDQMAQKFIDEHLTVKYQLFQMGSSIGTYVGDGAVALAFFKKSK